MSDIDQLLSQEFKLSDYIADLLSEDYQFIDKAGGKPRGDPRGGRLLDLMQNTSDDNYYGGPSPLAWNSIGSTTPYDQRGGNDVPSMRYYLDDAAHYIL